MNVEVFLLSAFGIDKSGGNPAGVVLNADGLTDDQMKLISREVGFSETAFVEKSDKADYKVRFFTPTEEVDICGHATVATYSLMLNKQLVKPGKYKQELKADVLPIEILEDATILMDLTQPQYGEAFEAENLVDIFNIDAESITSTGLRPQVVSTGNPNILVPVATRSTLFAMRPNFDEMAMFNEETDTIGFHVFTTDTIDPNATAHARNFFPRFGVNEEPATGSANASLACYLFENGIVSANQARDLSFEQGYSMEKPSLIKASLLVERQQIRRVQVGGQASLFGTKNISLN